MKNNFFSSMMVAVLALSSCMPSPTPTLTSPTATTVPPTPTPQGRTLLVTSPADSGPGTLRQALEEAQSGDTILFDPIVFPPDASMTIAISSELPWLLQGNLTVDASNAGVILDGSKLPLDSWIPGIAIDSQNNTIQGLQIVNFTGAGIALYEHASHNVIGGDRDIGSGPLGEGNLSGANMDGIGLMGATDNVITGNLIGVDSLGTTPLPIRGTGIFLREGSERNVIGPDNVIAFSPDAGIDVRFVNKEPITITRNSIHDNGVGIRLLGRGISAPIPPVILDFDLHAGTISGATCKKCRAEVFSTSSDQGSIYEGEAIADNSGFFVFKKDTSLTGPRLTATVTDPDGNTSEFSVPTTGAYRTLSLQQENNLLLILLSPKPSQDLLDNHIGVHYEGYDRYSDTEHAFTNGFRWVRIQSLTEFWGEGFEPKTFTLESIPPSVDRVISEYIDNGVNLVLDLWLGAGLSPYGTTFQGEEEVNRFSDYVRFMVSHFRGRIGYYQIWNEPGGVAVHDYANLVRQVVPIIRQEDPEARIIIGAVPGDWVDGYPGYDDYQRYNLNIDYLTQLIRSGVVPLVDGISWHPFYDNIPSDPYYQEYPETLKGIKDLAASQGFTGEYFADELLWRTVTEPGFDGGPPLHPLVAAKQYLRGILMHRGLGVNVTVITGFQTSAMWPIHNLNNVLAGAEPADIILSIAGEADNMRQYAFSIPNGDKLVAMWVNGELAEDDPGIPSTLTFPGTSAQKVIGIDVLHGFEQELIFEMENDALVIRNFLIKDYPIILRLID